MLFIVLALCSAVHEALTDITCEPNLHARRNLHDQEVPINVQSTCVRLMLNLVEVVMQRRQNATLPDLEAYRGLVASILATLSDKLAAVARNTPALMAEGAQLHHFLLPATSQTQAAPPSNDLDVVDVLTVPVPRLDDEPRCIAFAQAWRTERSA